MKKALMVFSAVMFVVVAWHARDIFIYGLQANHWVRLMGDIDHRMKPGDFPDLNSDNIRSRREADSISEEDFNIVFLGDSYAFGFLHPSVDTSPPARLEQLLRNHYKTHHINVWNFGWTSSSPYLSLRLLQDIGDKYRPDMVILNLDMTDFKDDFFYRQVISGKGIYRYARKYPRLFFFAKTLVSEIPFLKPLHQEWFGYPDAGDYFVARQPMSASKVYFDEVRDSLDRIHAYTRQRWGAPFLVFMPPRHWQYTDRESLHSWERGSYDVLGPYVLEPFRYFESINPPLEYPLVSLLEDFRSAEAFPLSFDKDSHWNSKGALVAAEAIFRHCEALGCFRTLEAQPGHRSAGGGQAVVGPLAQPTRFP